MRAKIATRESAISGFVLGRIFTFRRPCTLVRAPAWAGAVLSTDGLELTLNGTPPLYAMGDYNIILEEMHTHDMRAIVLNVSPQRAHTCVAAAVALMVALMIVVTAINFVLNKAAAGTVEPFGAQSMSSGTGAGAPLPTR